MKFAKDTTRRLPIQIDRVEHFKNLAINSCTKTAEFIAKSVLISEHNMACPIDLLNLNASTPVSVVSTAHALRILHLSKNIERFEQIFVGSYGFLIERQHVDGGWSSDINTVLSTTRITSIVLSMLVLKFSNGHVNPEVLKKGLARLVTTINADGGWSDAPDASSHSRIDPTSDVTSTSYAVRAVSRAMKAFSDNNTFCLPGINLIDLLKRACIWLMEYLDKDQTTVELTTDDSQSAQKILSEKTEAILALIEANDFLDLENIRKKYEGLKKQISVQLGPKMFPHDYFEEIEREPGKIAKWGHSLPELALRASLKLDSDPRSEECLKLVEMILKTSRAIIGCQEAIGGLFRCGQASKP